ncbi:MAG: arsenate reductase (glutaredoxin) [Arenicellales bacterium]
MTVTVYHNPRCSKSRAAMEYLEEHGIEADVVKYIDSPPDANDIKELLSMLGMSPRELMRKHEKVFKDAGLDDPTFTDDELIEAMAQCPSLIERPIVVNNGKAVLARPPETVQDIP